jgi:hypothetical protein
VSTCTGPHTDNEAWDTMLPIIRRDDAVAWSDDDADADRQRALALTGRARATCTRWTARVLRYPDGCPVRRDPPAGSIVWVLADTGTPLDRP